MKVQFSGQLGEFFTHLNWESEKVKELKNLTKMMGENSTILVEVDKRDHRRIKNVEVIEGGWLSRRWEIAKRKFTRGKTFHFGKNDIRRDIASYLDYLTEEVATLDKVSCDEKILHREVEKLEQLEQDVGEIADQLFHNTARGRALKGKMERLKRAFNDRFALFMDDRKIEEFGSRPMREPVGTRYVPEEAIEEVESTQIDDLRFFCHTLNLSVVAGECDPSELKEAIKKRFVEFQGKLGSPARMFARNLLNPDGPLHQKYNDQFEAKMSELKEMGLKENTCYLRAIDDMIDSIFGKGERSMWRLAEEEAVDEESENVPDDVERGNEPGNEPFDETGAVATESSKLGEKDHERRPVDDILLLVEKLGLPQGRDWCENVTSEEFHKVVKAKIEAHEKSTRQPFLAHNTIVSLLETKSLFTKEYRKVYEDLIRELHKEEGAISDEIWKEVLLALCKHVIKLRNIYD